MRNERTEDSASARAATDAIFPTASAYLSSADLTGANLNRADPSGLTDSSHD